MYVMMVWLNGQIEMVHYSLQFALQFVNLIENGI